jgi:hypothetical protein
MILNVLVIPAEAGTQDQRLAKWVPDQVRDDKTI